MTNRDKAVAWFVTGVLVGTVFMAVILSIIGIGSERVCIKHSVTTGECVKEMTVDELVKAYQASATSGASTEFSNEEGSK